MGLFSKKNNKVSTNGDARSSTGSNLSASSGLKSPSLARNSAAGSSFSPSSIDVSLPAPPDPTLDPAAYLKSIYAVRARCGLVYQRAKRNQLIHFDVDGSKFGETANYLVSILKVRHIHSRVELITNLQ